LNHCIHLRHFIKEENLARVDDQGRERIKALKVVSEFLLIRAIAAIPGLNDDSKFTILFMFPGCVNRPSTLVQA
jgi:hypothetical protein